MPPRSSTNPTLRPHRRGTTLVELAMALAMVAAVLSSLVLVNRTLRFEAAEAKTRHTLLTLQSALHLYAADHDAATPPGDASDALRALKAHPPTADHLAGLPLDRDANARQRLRDGFGQPLRYQPGDPTRRQPASFVSAGPSGRFGSADLDLAASRRAAADNLYGFELEAPTP